MTRPQSGDLSLKTSAALKKGATFHAPITPPSSPETESAPFRTPSLPPRSHSNLDDVIDSHRRRVALTLSNIEKSLSTSTDKLIDSLRDNNCLPLPRGILNHTLDTRIMGKEPEIERRVLRPRSRRPIHNHTSDSGLGSSIASGKEKLASSSSKKEQVTTKTKAAKSVASSTRSSNLPALSARATNRIYEHTLKPLLSKSSFKDLHPIVLECPKKIQEKEIVCLRDVEKALLLVAPVSQLWDNDKASSREANGVSCLKEKTKSAGLYLDFCLTTIRCIQATVEFLSDREQTRPRDLPYTSGYFIDLVDQIHQYARQLAEAKSDKSAGMDVDPYVHPNISADPIKNLTDIFCSSDEIKLHGGIHINGRPAELVRVKKNGKAISIATGEVVEILEESSDSPAQVKRSASEELEVEEEIMRSMARRKKNASPEELAPKKCREPGCNKEFKRPCDLTKHEKTHSRPWKCPVPTCKYHEYGWPTEKEMDRHHNDKHSASPPMYECLYKPCPYKSKRESNCKQHMEKAHGWTYVRTKTNGKKPSLPSIPGSISHTPQLQNMPTPSSEHSMGAATPPADHYGRIYSSIEFPTYIPNDAGYDIIPQEIQLDYSPVDNGTPSTDSGFDHSRNYQDMGNDFAVYDDIYSANVHVPAPPHTAYHKEMPHQYPAYTGAELCQSQPAPHLSPVGQNNAMLFTPTSLNGGDENFDDRRREYPSLPNSQSDFVLFPNGEVSKPMFNDPLFVAEVPSLAAGYSQPNSQAFMNALNNIGWSQGSYQSYVQQ
jgi:hypothetical protein